MRSSSARGSAAELSVTYYNTYKVEISSESNYQLRFCYKFLQSYIYSTAVFSPKLVPHLYSGKLHDKVALSSLTQNTMMIIL
jgi:hypothetical protein